jgi:GTP cyclohydrolase I
VTLGPGPLLHRVFTGGWAGAVALIEILQSQGAIVVIEAEHLRMTMLGVRKSGSKTITSAIRVSMYNAVTHTRR